MVYAKNSKKTPKNHVFEVFLLKKKQAIPSRIFHRYSRYLDPGLVPVSPVTHITHTLNPQGCPVPLTCTGCTTPKVE
jgi:hypothetical protein